MTISNPNMVTNASIYLQTPIPYVAIFKPKMSILTLMLSSISASRKNLPRREKCTRDDLQHSKQEIAVGSVATVAR